MQLLRKRCNSALILVNGMYVITRRHRHRSRSGSTNGTMPECVFVNELTEDNFESIDHEETALRGISTIQSENQGSLIHVYPDSHLSGPSVINIVPVTTSVHQSNYSNTKNNSTSSDQDLQASAKETTELESPFSLTINECYDSHAPMHRETESYPPINNCVQTDAPELSNVIEGDVQKPSTSAKDCVYETVDESMGSAIIPTLENEAYCGTVQVHASYLHQTLATVTAFNAPFSLTINECYDSHVPMHQETESYPPINFHQVDALELSNVTEGDVQKPSTSANDCVYDTVDESMGSAIIPTLENEAYCGTVQVHASYLHQPLATVTAFNHAQEQISNTTATSQTTQPERRKAASGTRNSDFYMDTISLESRSEQKNGTEDVHKSTAIPTVQNNTYGLQVHHNQADVSPFSLTINECYDSHVPMHQETESYPPINFHQVDALELSNVTEGDVQKPSTSAKDCVYETVDESMGSAIIPTLENEAYCGTVQVHASYLHQPLATVTAFNHAQQQISNTTATSQTTQPERRKAASGTRNSDFCMDTISLESRSEQKNGTDDVHKSTAIPTVQNNTYGLQVHHNQADVSPFSLTINECYDSHVPMHQETESYPPINFHQVDALELSNVTEGDVQKPSTSAKDCVYDTVDESMGSAIIPTLENEAYCGTVQVHASYLHQPLATVTVTAFNHAQEQISNTTATSQTTQPERRKAASGTRNLDFCMDTISLESRSEQKNGTEDVHKSTAIPTVQNNTYGLQVHQNQADVSPFSLTINECYDSHIPMHQETESYPPINFHQVDALELSNVTEGDIQKPSTSAKDCVYETVDESMGSAIIPTLENEAYTRVLSIRANTQSPYIDDVDFATVTNLPLSHQPMNPCTITTIGASRTSSCLIDDFQPSAHGEPDREYATIPCGSGPHVIFTIPNEAYEGRIQTPIDSDNPIASVSALSKLTHSGVRNQKFQRTSCDSYTDLTSSATVQVYETDSKGQETEYSVINDETHLGIIPIMQNEAYEFPM